MPQSSAETLNYGWRHSIGTRLGLAICVVFAGYLLAVGVSIFGLYQQYQGFQKLSTYYFERALTAAELTRDAELIAAEVFESMVGADRSDSARTSGSANLMKIYQSVRARLDAAEDGEESSQLAAIDRWQEPYFSSLESLNQQLSREYQLKSAQLKLVDALFDQLQQLELQIDTALVSQEADDLRFISHALAALSYSATTLRAERPGQLAQLQASARTHFEQLQRLTALSPNLLQLRQPMTELLARVLSERPPMLRAERATLATARETRVLAQKLTSSTFNYYQQLKNASHKAVEMHQQRVTTTVVAALVFALMMVVLTVFVILYIRRMILRRLKRLHWAVNAHMSGNTVPIPHAGNDEISGLGRAFENFAAARYAAEGALSVAQRETQEVNLQLQQANERLRFLSEVDELTGIANRRVLDQHLIQEWRRARRHSNSLSLIMIDIDWFKEYNDHYGHPAGDACLRQVAQALSVCLQREGELVARYGGEEFCIVLPQLSPDEAMVCAERLQRAVADLSLEHPRGRVTLSIGVATACAGELSAAQMLLENADQALYKAKTAGRNRIVARVNGEPECEVSL